MTTYAVYAYHPNADEWVQVGPKTADAESRAHAVLAFHRDDRNGHMIAVRSPINPGSMAAEIKKALADVTRTHKRQTIYVTNLGVYRHRDMGERVNPLWWRVDDVPHGRLKIDYDPNAPNRAEGRSIDDLLFDKPTPAAAAKLNYTRILNEAFTSPAAPERPLGIGRIYVVIDKGHARGVAKAAKALGKIFQTKAHYGMKNALYIGYDNHDGRALARGTKVVEVLKAHGIGAYRDEHGD